MDVSEGDDRRGEAKALGRRGCCRVLALRARLGHLGCSPLPRSWPFLEG